MFEQCRQRPLVPRVERVVDGLRRQTPRPGATRQADPLQCIRARQHQPPLPQTARQSFQDGLSVIGVERGPGRHKDRLAPVLSSRERMQPEMPDGQLSVLRSRCLSGGIADQRHARHPGLFREPGDQLRRRLDAVEPSVPRMAKKRDVNSHPEPVVGSSPGRNECPILIRQDVVALQRPDIGPCVREERPTDISQCCEADRMKLGYLRVYASQRRSRRKTLHFNLLRNPRPTTTLTGRVVLPVLTGVAEFERPLIAIRTEEGRRTARVPDDPFDRRPKLRPDQRTLAR